jgi:hypothetical protein
LKYEDKSSSPCHPECNEGRAGVNGNEKSELESRGRGDEE